jgi:hypothetical protein
LAFDIEKFKAGGLQYGGDRASKFHVQMAIPALATGDASAIEKFTFTCEATRIPDFTLGTASAPYFGRELPLPGDRTFEPWVVQVQNDEDYLVRRAFETWSHRINALRKNTTVAPITAVPSSYMTDAWIYKYGKAGNLLRTYKMVGCWPSRVSGIDLSWAQRDEITRFSVEFRYMYFDPDESMAQEGSGAAN